MKITSFQLTIQQGVDKNGYTDNYYVNIDDNGMTNISYPYKSIPHKEQLAIFSVIQTAIARYDELAELCDKANRALKLEEYAPQVSTVEASSESTDVSASPQSCALGGGEVSTEIKDAPFEEVSAGAVSMDEAKTPKQILEAMTASGERKEVRDLPM